MRSISLHPYLQLQEDDDEYIKASAKLSKTFEILDGIQRNGKKALIFLESKKMQGILYELLKRRYVMKKALPFCKVYPANRSESLKRILCKREQTEYKRNENKGLQNPTVICGHSIVVYEKWRNIHDDTMLKQISDYNKEDCRSTYLLR